MLFAIFVNDVLKSLNNSGRGCYIKGMCMNSFMYADDLILAAITVNDIQYLVDLCVEQFGLIGLEINIKKSASMRIGRRHGVAVSDLSGAGNLWIKWVQEIKYLGITICSAKSFKTIMQSLRHKFLRALNGIFGKVGLKTSISVLISLIESCCVSILLYSCESIMWNRTMFDAAENAYSMIFRKIFKTNDKTIIQQCQYYCNQLPAELKIVSRKVQFVENLTKSDNSILRMLGKLDEEVVLLKQRYGINSVGNVGKYCIWKYFESKIVF